MTLMNDTNELMTALQALAHANYNMTGPHPQFDQIDRPAAVALAMFKARMHVDDMRDAVRQAMDGRHDRHGRPAPFPDDEKRRVLNRIQDMMGMLSYLKEQGYSL